jgi:hypothetical protein
MGKIVDFCRRRTTIKLSDAVSYCLVFYNGLVRRCSMFDSLADRMKADDKLETNNTEKMIRWLAVAVLSVLLFGGLYFGVRMLE